MAVEKQHQQIKELQATVRQQQQQIAELERRLLGQQGAACPESAALQQALAEAQRVNRLKSEFLDTVSHEIRTAINAITGMTGLVLESDLQPDQEEYLRLVSTSVDRLLEVVNEVLDFSKIEAGVLELRQEDFHLKESLDHDLYLLRLQAEEKGLTLTCTIGNDVPEALSGDPQRLVQVLTSLVGNALKFTSSGGVAIQVTHGGYDQAGRLLLTFIVQDSGAGLRRDQLQQLRAAFQKQTQQTALVTEGLGLGLAVASQLVRLMDGSICVEGGSDGAIFSFTLPFREIADSEDEPEEPATTEQVSGPSPLFVLQGARILLVEDEPINRLLLETLLNQAGAEVDCAVNGREAVQMAQQKAYQVVVMDVQLPELDGLEATRAIRQMEKKQGRDRCTILALTAHATQADREKCLRAGMDDYCSKPIDKNQLFALLGKYLTPSALLVESVLTSKQDMVRFLVEKGWNVTLAETARAAMYEACLSHFDMILLDTQMLQMDCVEVARVIRQLEEYSGRHATIIGVGQEEGAEQRCLIGGLDGCLRWPASRAELAAKMRTISPAWNF